MPNTMGYMEYIEQFDSVLAGAICTIDGIPDFLASLQVAATYGVDSKVKAALAAYNLGLPPVEAAVIFAVQEGIRFEKPPGLLSAALYMLMPKENKSLVTRIQKIRNLLFSHYQKIPADKVEKYLLALQSSSKAEN